MTISTTTNKILYAGLTGQDTFAYNFRVDQKSDMNVFLAGEIIPDGDWTITDLGQAAGGDVTLNTPLASDQSVTLLREVDETQEVDYQPFDAFPAETHEGALDKLTMLTQQLQEQLDRTLTASVDSPAGVDYTLPPPDVGKGLIWNETADGLVNSDDEINGITVAAQASADDSAVSAAESAVSAAESAASAADAENTFDDKHAGFESTGLHVNASDVGLANLDDIVVNSVYNALATAITNGPADFIEGSGALYTNMTNFTGTGSQVLFGNNQNAYKQWMRERVNSTWGEWIKVVDGPAGSGATTITSTPPVDPNPGDVWWTDIDGLSFIWYDDGDSAQWVEQVPPKDALDTFSQHLDGYELTGLHKESVVDLNTILLNSKYITNSDAVNVPTDFDTTNRGFLVTSMHTATFGNQLLYGRSGVNANKIWMRSLVDSVWDAWILVASAATAFSAYGRVSDSAVVTRDNGFFTAVTTGFVGELVCTWNNVQPDANYVVNATADISAARIATAFGISVTGFSLRGWDIAGTGSVVSILVHCVRTDQPFV